MLYFAHISYNMGVIEHIMLGIEYMLQILRCRNGKTKESGKNPKDSSNEAVATLHGTDDVKRFRKEHNSPGLPLPDDCASILSSCDSADYTYTHADPRVPRTWASAFLLGIKKLRRMFTAYNLYSTVEAAAVNYNEE